MTKLPELIQHYLYSSWQKSSQFACVSFDTHGLIQNWHPHIKYYGFTDLHKGDLATDKLIFLQGLIPPYQDTNFFILPSVNLTDNIAADIHILPAEKVLVTG